MVSEFLTVVSKDLSLETSSLLLVKNPDGFLLREAGRELLSLLEVRVLKQDGLNLRIDFELNYKEGRPPTIYLIENEHSLLEDMLDNSEMVSFHLMDYFQEYDSEVIERVSLKALSTLFENKPLLDLNHESTKKHLKDLTGGSYSSFIIEWASVKKEALSLINQDQPSWKQFILLVSKMLNKVLGSPSEKEFWAVCSDINDCIQAKLLDKYKHAISASAIRRPKIVSSILPHLAEHYLDEKIALIVIDGMAYWQYLLLKDIFDDKVEVEENCIFSWLPSITQLSRQAIFSDGLPVQDYVQNPRNEEKLWQSYWSKKGKHDYEIKYDHGGKSLNKLNRVSKYALVLTELDEKMHSCSDYNDLSVLTKNWLKRSEFSKLIDMLLRERFTVFLTTDHGNVPATGWRSLKPKEKIGTKESGSRSARHIIYSDRKLADDFVAQNPMLKNSITQEKSVLYMTDQLSFSNKKEHITHGGSHFLEVLIPFIKINHV